MGIARYANGMFTSVEAVCGATNENSTPRAEEMPDLITKSDVYIASFGMKL